MHRLCRSVLAVAGTFLLLFASVACGEDAQTAREFVAAKYTRATALDQVNDGRAYTATIAPAAVVEAITKAERPLDNRTLNERVYLQYRDDILTVAAHGAGALILVDQYRNGYRRHQSAASSFGWQSEPAGSEYRSSSGK
ncbi:DUF4247 domain-containing protein [Nocardia shimofusensis]|uniref:DUF4247 domain-containing protein n=1 Tax=Nocardia shimofusensis TaxID=228596 RepID=UPI00082A6670|nr:DUF4247 domain-containing protein [Nocardia shimofusensis]